MKVVIAYQNTKGEEDFILTPALFGIWHNSENIFVIGIGIVWGWWSIGITLAKGAPKDYPNFRNITTKKFYCQSKIEGRFTCNNQCEHCEEYYKPLEN
jgi:hypothetical protein